MRVKAIFPTLAGDNSTLVELHEGGLITLAGARGPRRGGHYGESEKTKM